MASSRYGRLKERGEEERKRGEGEGGERRAVKCTVTTKFGVVLPTPKVT